MKARHVLLTLGLVAALALNAMDPPDKDEGLALPLVRVRGVEAAEAGAKPSEIDASLAPSPVPLSTGSLSPGSPSPGLVATGPAIAPLASREMLFAPRRQRGAQGLFEPRSWDPPAPARQVEAVARPSAPPLPFRFVGRQWIEGRQEVFISAGDKVLIARAGEQLDGGFRIDAVEPGRILFTYLPLETPFQLQFGAPE